MGFFICFVQTTNFSNHEISRGSNSVPREFSWKCLWFDDISRGNESGILGAILANFRSSLVLAVSSLRSPAVTNPPFPQPHSCEFPICGYVALWLCSYVAMWLYGYVAMWLCGQVAALGEPAPGLWGNRRPAPP